MTLITLEEASTWFSANGWPEDVREDSLPLPRFDFLVPKDSGRKTALARAISQAYDDDADLLFLIKAWDIWPSSASMFLFDRVRETTGDARTIEQAPGHRLKGSERDWLEALLAMTFYFIWEAVLIDDKGDLAVWISHDEWMRIHSRDQAQLESWRNCLESSYNLTRR